MGLPPAVGPLPSTRAGHDDASRPGPIVQVVQRPGRWDPGPQFPPHVWRRGGVREPAGWDGVVDPIA